MKYTVETTSAGSVKVHILTKYGIFSQEWTKKLAGVVQTKDEDLVDQVEKMTDGNDECYLDDLYELLSNVDMFPADMLSFAEKWEKNDDT